MRAAEILERLSVAWKHGEHVDLAGVTCEGRLDLSGREIPGVDFSGATFPEGIDFSLIEKTTAPGYRMMQPTEPAALIAYLSSDEAAAINGAVIPIDYGITA